MPSVGQWLWLGLQLPGCPFGSSPDSADVIVVPAFGRNRLADRDLTDLRQWHDAHQAGDAVTLAWCRERIDVGDPNRALGMMLISLMHQTQLPAIVQWEVLAACPSDWCLKHETQLRCLWPPFNSSGYNSLEVLDDVAVTMVAHGWQRPLLLAHDLHAMRFAMLMNKRLGGWPAIARGLPDGFDHRSVQWQTQSHLSWSWYQVMATGHHVLHRLL